MAQQFILDIPLVRGSSLSQGLRYSNVLGKSSSTNAIATGSATFAVASNLNITAGQRIRASLVDNPITDPLQYLEGPETSYSGSLLTFNADTISGVAGTVYSSWLLTAAVDLTGGTFDASMRFSPASCAGRARSPIPLTINVTGSPTYGLFSIYLPPTTTAVLALGDYTYKVLFTPSMSSDKLLVVSGTVSVVDE